MVEHLAKIGMGRLQHDDGLQNAWGVKRENRREGGDEAWAGRDAHVSCII